MSNTFYLIMAIIFFVLAVVAVIFGIRAIKTGKTINTRYNRLRDSLPESEQKKRDKLVGFSNILAGVAAIAFGCSAYFQFEGLTHWIAVITMVVSVVIDSLAIR